MATGRVVPSAKIARTRKTEKLGRKIGGQNGEKGTKEKKEKKKRRRKLCINAHPS